MFRRGRAQAWTPFLWCTEGGLEHTGLDQLSLINTNLLLKHSEHANKTVTYSQLSIQKSWRGCCPISPTTVRRSPLTLSHNCGESGVFSPTSMRTDTYLETMGWNCGPDSGS